MANDPKVWQLPNGNIVTDYRRVSGITEFAEYSRVSTEAYEDFGRLWFHRSLPEGARRMVALPSARVSRRADGCLVIDGTDGVLHGPGVGLDGARMLVERSKAWLAEAVAAAELLEAEEAAAEAAEDVEDAATVERQRADGRPRVPLGDVLRRFGVDEGGALMVTPEVLKAVVLEQLLVTVTAEVERREAEAAARRRVLEDLKPGVYNMASEQEAEPDTIAMVTGDGRLMVRQFDDGSLFDCASDYLGEDGRYTYTLLASGDLTPVVSE